MQIQECNFCTWNKYMTKIEDHEKKIYNWDN